MISPQKNTIYNKKCIGLTLLELAIVLVILGLLTQLGVALLRLGLRVWKKIEDKTDKALIIQSSRTLIQSELERVYPKMEHSGSDYLVSFAGESTNLTFWGALPQSLSRKYPVHIKLYLDYQIGRKKELILSWNDGFLPNAWNRVTLLSDIKDLNIEYFGERGSNGQLYWSKSWIKQKELPKAIKLNIIFEPGENYIWPPLIVSPMITMDTSCSYDGFRITGCID